MAQASSAPSSSALSNQRQQQFFNLNVETLVNDLCNPISKYMCDAIDSISERSVSDKEISTQSNSHHPSSIKSFRNLLNQNQKSYYSEHAISLKSNSEFYCNYFFDVFERYIERNIFAIPTDLDLSSSKRINKIEDSKVNMKEKEIELDNKIRAAHERLREIVQKQKKAARDRSELESAYKQASNTLGAMEKSKSLLNEEELVIVLKNGEQLKKLSGLVEGKFLI